MKEITLLLIMKPIRIKLFSVIMTVLYIAFLPGKSNGQCTPPTVSAANISSSSTLNNCAAQISFGPNVTITGSPTPNVTYKIGATIITSPRAFPVGTTVVTVRATNSCGIDTAIFLVTINDLQAPVLTCPGNQTICAVNYTIADPISDNCSSNTTWGYTLSGATSGSVSGIADGTGSGSIPFNPGNTTVTLNGTDGTNTATACSFVVTVNASPVASVTGNTSFCQGITTTLCAGSTTSSYLWSTGATTKCIKVNTADTFTITVTSNNGCSASASVATNVKPSPAATITATGPTTFCSGTNALSLTANAGTGYTYKWKKGSSYLTGATSISYAPASTGTYKTEVTNTDGCSKLSAGIAVTVNPLPAATITPQGPVTFCAGGSVVLQAGSSLAYTYQWKKGPANITGATLSNYTATTAGKYKVIVTNSNGCSKTSGAITVTINCRSGNSSIDEADIKVFPNPAHEKITVQFNANIDEKFVIMLTDITGRIIIKEEGKVTEKTNHHEIDLSGYAKGRYVITLKTDTYSEQVKVFVE